jgi:hypothetical protein
MQNASTQELTKTKVAIEQQISSGYKVATIVITASGVLALVIFSIVWRLKP